MTEKFTDTEIDSLTGVKTEFEYDGKHFDVKKTQDVSPILDLNKERQSEGVNLKAGMRHAASIPAIIWEQWDKEFYRMHKRSLLGAPKKLKEKFMKAKLNDPSNKFLRTWQGKL